MSERWIVLDVETTGLSHQKGDRIIEIGAIEYIDGKMQKEFQRYINPEIIVPEDSVRVHGITNEFLEGKPLFEAVAHEFWEFLQSDHPEIIDTTLVAHNAPFDVGFFEAEFARIEGHPLSQGKKLSDFFTILDTLRLARQKFGSGMSLDRLCDRLGIDRSQRTKHGALLDSQILAEAYLALISGQIAMEDLDATMQDMQSIAAVDVSLQGRPKLIEVGKEAHEAHEAYMLSLKS